MIVIKNSARPIKDLFYELITEPTKENFQNFIESTTGEENNVDFKREWIDKEELSKLFLAMANSGGGIIIFGIAENEDGGFKPIGIESLMDPADIQNTIERYVPTSLKYKTYNFCFDSSKYDKLQGKNFQMVLIEDIPEQLPFISIGQGEHILSNTIYVRRGTKNEQANTIEIEKMLDKRINHMHSLSSIQNLKEELEQLEFLYNKLNQRQLKENQFQNFKENIRNKYCETIFNDNESIEDFEQFIIRMIKKKKKKIERILD